jgi:hypothetical protein
MRTKLAVLAAMLACLAPSLVAHHGWTIDYDPDKPVAVKGVVTKIEWTNPHIHFYVDSTDDKGTVTSWNFEMASPLALQRGGWSRKALPIGTQVTVGGYGGRAIKERAVANSIKLADGKDLFVGALGQ